MKKLMLMYKFGFSLIALAAVLIQFFDNAHKSLSLVNFFSYFTIESNIFGLVVLFSSGIFALQKKQNQTLSYIRGAATLYMVVTGIVYALLLSGADVQISFAWVNYILHYIFPVVMLLDWLFDRPQPALSLKKALWWLAFPVMYLPYSLVRGLIVHWYPYPFVDPRQQGYLKVATMSVIIAVAGIVLTLLLAKYTQLGVPAATKKRR